mgnify:CR=1 FL=1|tara:strand:- start:295 stop:540 length:246 start_codon:yes stop_codon:yes gene_type:complete
MSEEKTLLDDALVRMLDAGTAVGMSAIPVTVPPEIKSLAQAAVARALLWVVRQIEPDQLKVVVENQAKATAEIDWGEDGKE